jgi:Transposase, Mutator family
MPRKLLHKGVCWKGNWHCRGDRCRRGASLRDGKKALLHLAPGTKEDTASCRKFFQEMRRRGLPDPLLVVSDGAPGMIRAIEECLPRSIRQRRLAHKMRNLQSKVPEDVWPSSRPVPRHLTRRPRQHCAPAARRHCVDIRQGSAVGGGLSRRRRLRDAQLRFPLGHRPIAFIQQPADLTHA